MAKDAYLTMAVDYLEDIPEQKLKQIINYIIAKAFFRAGAAWEKGASPAAQSAFYLNLNTNVIFILMFGERGLPETSNVMQLRNAINDIDHNIKIPLKLERKKSHPTFDFD